jgi:hypothetical protein
MLCCIFLLCCSLQFFFSLFVFPLSITLISDKRFAISTLNKLSIKLISVLFDFIGVVGAIRELSNPANSLLQDPVYGFSVHSQSHFSIGRLKVGGGYVYNNLYVTILTLTTTKLRDISPGPHFAHFYLGEGPSSRFATTSSVSLYISSPSVLSFITRGTFSCSGMLLLWFLMRTRSEKFWAPQVAGRIGRSACFIQPFSLSFVLQSASHSASVS